MNQALPFVTFQPGRGQSAADAMELYLSVFAGGRVIADRRWGAEGPGAEGTVIMAEIEIAGLRLRFSDSFVTHEWDLTPGVSLAVDCESAEELERIFTALGEGGTIYMPLDDYGFGQFGWVGDRFGLTWQLGLAGS